MSAKIVTLSTDQSLQLRLDRELSQSGFDVVGAKDLGGGIAHARSIGAVCVVLDEGVIEASGGFPHLAEQPIADVPTVLLLATSRVASAEVRAAWEAGIDIIVPTPFTREELAGAIRRASSSRGLLDGQQPL